MQLALIPPKGMYSRCHQGTAYMALAHLVDDDHYAKEYQEAASDSKLILIDNGAAEGAQVQNSDLANAALYIGATEIIIPDVLRAKLQTETMCRKWFSYWSARKHQFAVTFQGVIQGTNVTDLKSMVDFYTRFDRITTIGIPRWTVDRFENRSVRIDLANWIRQEFGERFKVHFLGTSARWPSEILRAAKYAPHVRSCDTSMPFNYGMADVSLSTETREQVRRLPNYFEVPHMAARAGVIDANIHIMKRWAMGHAK